jgi:DNA-directed RNA polymerase specialized sigma24 family protein
MKSTDPETRNSLIMRLPNQGDQDAWGQFVAIYDPLIYRLARLKGFQDADAKELVQEVLLAVSKAVHRWVRWPTFHVHGCLLVADSQFECGG